ncbi:MAG: ammonium transporter [Planctomycetota bacterium]
MVKEGFGVAGSDLNVGADILIAAALVFVMHLGFAALESGLTQAKNTTNILFKNTAIVAIGLLTYAFVGFNLMYPGAWSVEGWLAAISTDLFWIDDSLDDFDASYNPAYSYWSDFIFQAMFAATAATIVSGAVAERIRLGPFLVFSAVYVAVVYPLCGSWKWGGGWLEDRGFHDFAGSTLVHSVGGWGALAGAIMLGPRLGKYLRRNDGTAVTRPIMGHSMPFAAVGVFLLWFGWFGFNGGSVLSADPATVSFVFVTTTLAAAAGAIAAMATSWIVQSKPDLTMMLNGVLAGLVGITAGADTVSVSSAVLIGAIAGAIVVLSVVAFERLKIDDPVGAISVHLVCGIWGTLAVGIFSTDPDHSFVEQLIGVVSIGALCVPASFALFAALRYTVGIRVSREEELRGLDIGEHGMEAYAGFQFFTSS